MMKLCFGLTREKRNLCELRVTKTLIGSNPDLQKKKLLVSKIIDSKPLPSQLTQPKLQRAAPAYEPLTNDERVEPYETLHNVTTTAAL